VNRSTNTLALADFNIAPNMVTINLLSGIFIKSELASFFLNHSAIALVDGENYPAFTSKPQNLG
jgi:hypothetical protein